MLNIHLTLPVVANLLRTIAQNEPDRVGREEDGAGCTYASEKNGVLYPICIVGQMFANLGLLRLLLADPNNLRNEYGTPGNLGACSVGFDFWESLSNNGVTADSDAQEFMRSVQTRQDDGFAWGEAFDLAEQEYRQKEQDALDSRLNVLFS